MRVAPGVRSRLDLAHPVRASELADGEVEVLEVRSVRLDSGQSNALGGEREDEVGDAALVVELQLDAAVLLDGEGHHAVEVTERLEVGPILGVEPDHGAGPELLREIVVACRR